MVVRIDRILRLLLFLTYKSSFVSTSCTRCCATLGVVSSLILTRNRAPEKVSRSTIFYMVIRARFFFDLIHGEFFLLRACCCSLSRLPRDREAHPQQSHTMEGSSSIYAQGRTGGTISQLGDAHSSKDRCQVR